MVYVGTEAVFTCQHANATFIRWKINGSFVKNPSIDVTPDTIRNENGTLVDTLTIIARAEYNQTTVVCVAQFDDGTPNEESIPVTLSGVYA